VAGRAGVLSVPRLGVSGSWCDQLRVGHHRTHRASFQSMYRPMPTNHQI
jgi:hypothetical protein